MQMYLVECPQCNDVLEVWATFTIARKTKAEHNAATGHAAMIDTDDWAG